MEDVLQMRDRLLAVIRGYRSCAVAFSAGVDSTVVAKAAELALGQAAVAVTGVGAALAEGELEEARSLARAIGIRHVETPTDEINDANYIRNSHDRCFHCKTELYTHVERIAAQEGLAAVVNGANADDAGDYRPGAQAAAQHAVRSPLAECGLSKSDIRELARHWELPVWDKPAAPCLASRIAYGVEVTPERLSRVDRAEQLLRSLGHREVRVRYHADDLARLEVPIESIESIAAPEVRRRLLEGIRDLGFKYVTLDLAGFQSGSLNVVVPVESLTKFSAASPNPPQ